MRQFSGGPQYEIPRAGRRSVGQFSISIWLKRLERAFTQKREDLSISETATDFGSGPQLGVNTLWASAGGSENAVIRGLATATAAAAAAELATATAEAAAEAAAAEALNGYRHLSTDLLNNFGGVTNAAL